MAPSIRYENVARMTTFGWIVGTTVLISLTAWIGVLALFLREELLDRILLVLVALAAGALIRGAFLHLLPRAIAETGTGDTLPVFLILIAGFCTFYVLEQFIHWHHHHEAVHDRNSCRTSSWSRMRSTISSTGW